MVNNHFWVTVSSDLIFLGLQLCDIESQWYHVYNYPYERIHKILHFVMGYNNNSLHHFVLVS